MKHNILRNTAEAIVSTLILLPNVITSVSAAAPAPTGGGYAASEQLHSVGYASELYDATNGLPSSDAMYLLGASDGHMWIGGNSGVICYDGSTFKRMDPSGGTTNARGFFEDSHGRIWVGTNDNGVVVVDGMEHTHLTYNDGLPSSSIRCFAEDNDGNVFIGTTTGICYADKTLGLHSIENETLANERVLNMDSDANGMVYGQTTNGIVFSIKDHTLSALYTSNELGMEKITAIMSDPEELGTVYIGTSDSSVYHGKFGEKAANCKYVKTPELGEAVHFINYDCGRVWVSSKSAAGYLDEEMRFHLLEHLPITSGIEMMTSDYQGNLWIASSTQGIAKVVSNNFVDVSDQAGLPEEVCNAVWLYNDNIFIGTDNGLQIIDKNGKAVEDPLTKYIGTARIRCFAEDANGDLYIAAYTDELGLIRYSSDGEISAFTTANGMPSNQIRCVCKGNNNSMVAGTDGGVAVIRNGSIVRTYGKDKGISNPMIQSIMVTKEGTILAGTDGDGIYVIENDKISRLGRDDGLTSDVISSFTNDEEHGIIWILTSNSIEYMKNGRILPLKTFPSTNNYSIDFDDNGNAWVLSSYGVYVVNADDMAQDKITDHDLYTIENGLPYAITSGSHSTKDTNGNLYFSGRNGIIMLNMNHFYEEYSPILTGVSAVSCDDEIILPNETGVYHIPASRGRIQIAASVMDYSMLNPLVHVYLEDGPDDGITVLRSELTNLEYTNLRYGDYKLHIQILDKNTGEILQDSVFNIHKTARFTELVITKILFMILLTILAGVIVWRVLRSTIIARQYDEIRAAKEDAERTNTAQSRFLANISNGIRTPINTIMGMNEMTMREDATGVPKEYFMSIMNYAFDIQKSSETLMGLINDLLDISKIESGSMHLTEHEYDVQEILRSFISVIRIRSSAKGLVFDYHIDEMLPQRLFGDEGKIKQIVLNFLTNAVKYTIAGTVTLTISMEERNDDMAALRFTVKDTGTGIKNDEIKKLFTTYEKLDEKRDIKGIGLGLDISRRFADLMGGKIQCSSIYGEGSEFTLTLKQKIINGTPIGEFVEQTAKGNKGRYIPQFIAPDADVLIIDSNAINLSMMKGLLRETRVFVTTTRNAKDALDMIRDSHFDVVLSDLATTDPEDDTFITKVREIDKDLPVYALTSDLVETDRLYRTKEYTGFLIKPIDGETLEKTIMQHLSEQMIERPRQKMEAAAPKELPQELLWLNEIPELSVEDGIRNALGVQQFIFSLKLFLDTIDSNTKVIRKAFENGDINLLGVKVHSVQHSANLIGALALSDDAAAIERAAAEHDQSYIRDNIENLLSDYESFKQKLSVLNQMNIES